MSDEPQETPVTEPVDPETPPDSAPILADQTSPAPAPPVHPTGIILEDHEVQGPSGAEYDGEEIDEEYEDDPEEEETFELGEQIPQPDVQNGGK